MLFKQKECQMVQLLLAIIYLVFISYGVSDSLLGSAWPTIYTEFGITISYMGIISVILALCMIVTSLINDSLTKRLGSGKVAAIGMGLAAAALFGFSNSHNFISLCLCAIPYGLGAGNLDASINNYIARHYASRWMSWMHCMWGVGASIGPYIMSYALTGGQGWNTGYRYVAILQVVMTIILVLSLPLWKKRVRNEKSSVPTRAMKISEIVKIPGAKAAMLTCFFYCSLEHTASLWASSYLVLHLNLPRETGAVLASLFFIGITLGRALSGFLTIKFDNKTMVRMGLAVASIGIIMLFFPLGRSGAFISLAIIGLGIAPIYPCVLHSTPQYFTDDQAQAILGVQFASFHAGNLLVPACFGLIATYISIEPFPIFLLVLAVAMMFTHEILIKKTAKTSPMTVKTA